MSLEDLNKEAGQLFFEIGKIDYTAKINAKMDAEKKAKIYDRLDVINDKLGRLQEIETAKKSALNTTNGPTLVPAPTEPVSEAPVPA